MHDDGACLSVATDLDCKDLFQAIGLDITSGRRLTVTKEFGS